MAGTAWWWQVSVSEQPILGASLHEVLEFRELMHKREMGEDMQRRLRSLPLPGEEK